MPKGKPAPREGMTSKAVLELLASKDGKEWPVAELAERLGANRDSLRACLSRLARLGRCRQVRRGVFGSNLDAPAAAPAPAPAKPQRKDPDLERIERVKRMGETFASF